jgi:DUF4097 and DUF4098 domain-containing protein YvlB
MKPALSRALLGSALLVASGCTVSLESLEETAREEKRFTVSGVPEVRLTTFDGPIEVRTWERAEVLVEVEKRASTKEGLGGVEVVATQNGNVIELEARRQRKEALATVRFERSPSARLIVSVPAQADIRARTSDGSIRLDGVKGRIDLRTGDGSIRVAQASGELTCETGDGSVTVDDAEGRLAVDTGDGGVRVSGKLASVRLRTNDGAIIYRAQPGTTMADEWDISTGDGSVSLYLPTELSAELDAQTADGSIRSELRVSGADPQNRKHLRGRLGASGGRMIRVRTGDGSIRLRPY